jgi:uncharacterized membrane protein affecting hemolysin expression
MKFEVKDIVLFKWIVVFLALVILYVLFLHMNTVNENKENKELTLSLIKQITAKNDSIIASKTAEIEFLLFENAQSKKVVEKAELKIDSLLASMEAKKGIYRRRKKVAGELSGKELVNYWRDEVK